MIRLKENIKDNYWKIIQKTYKEQRSWKRASTGFKEAKVKLTEELACLYLKKI